MKQSKQSKLETLNQRAQELMRIADSINHAHIDDEISDLNSDWKKKLDELENTIQTQTVLSNHWQDFEKQCELLEKKLNHLEEKVASTKLEISNIKSKQHVLDTKDIYQVSIYQLEISANRIFPK